MRPERYSPLSTALSKPKRKSLNQWLLEETTAVQQLQPALVRRLPTTLPSVPCGELSFRRNRFHK